MEIRCVAQLSGVVVEDADRGKSGVSAGQDVVARITDSQTGIG